MLRTAPAGHRGARPHRRDPRRRRAGAHSRRCRALEACRARGIAVMAFGDPDVGSGAFRGATPENFARLAAGLGGVSVLAARAPRHGLADRARPAGDAAHRCRRRGRASRRRHRGASRRIGARAHAPLARRGVRRDRAPAARAPRARRRRVARVRRDRARHASGHGPRGGARRSRGADALERAGPPARDPARRCATCCASSTWPPATTGPSTTWPRRCVGTVRAPRPDRAAPAALGAAPHRARRAAGSAPVANCSSRRCGGRSSSTSSTPARHVAPPRSPGRWRHSRDELGTRRDRARAALDRVGPQRPRAALVRARPRSRSARRSGGSRSRRRRRPLPGGEALRRALARRRSARVRARHPRQRRRRRPSRRARRATTSVRILTPAGALGTEFDTVVIAGVQDGVWPNTRLRGRFSRRGDWRMPPPAPTRVLRARSTGAAPRCTTSCGCSCARCLRATALVVVTAVDDDDTGPSVFFEFLPDPERYTVDHPLSLRGLVAQHRRALTEPTHARAGGAGGRQLALLADAGVAGAAPREWFGVARPTSTRTAARSRARGRARVAVATAHARGVRAELGDRRSRRRSRRRDGRARHDHPRRAGALRRIGRGEPVGGRSSRAGASSPSRRRGATVPSARERAISCGGCTCTCAGSKPTAGRSSAPNRTSRSRSRSRTKRRSSTVRSSPATSTASS